MFRSMGATALAASLALAPLVGAGPASAQSGPGWFVPKQAAAPQAQPAEPARHMRTVRGPAPLPPPDSGVGAGEQEAQGGQPSGPPPVLPLPPVPTPGTVTKGAAPPAAVIGVISVPDIMRASLSAQQVQKVLGERRDKLTQDVQREQMVWRDIQTSLQDNKTLSPDQLRTRARALQERVLSAQRTFKNRQRIIQEAAQVAINQIERELVQVIREVSASRNMNLVLHQEQVALDVQGFDITQQVVEQLNQVLPQVFIPADGVDPEQLAKDGTFPTTAQPGAMNLAGGGKPIAPAGAPAAQPVSASAPAPKK